MWEMKGDKYTKSFAKIQVRRIFRIRDIRKKCFTQTYRDLYGDDMMVPNKTSVTEFWYKCVNLLLEELINIKVTLLLIHELLR